MEKENEKKRFLISLKEFANTLADKISNEDEWTMRGFIDIFRNVYTISSDTKVISKILELHLFPYFLAFAEKEDYEIELATCQNWYPDLTFIKKDNKDIKFAVDLKTTYRSKKNSNECNGFTLGSHGAYFSDRNCSKNIQYPYNKYLGHFCLGIIYTRTSVKIDETKRYGIDELEKIPAVIKDFVFFVEEKWKIASDKSGSGNTANIGSIKNIDDILSGNGVFALAGESIFDDYWINFGKIEILEKDGEKRKITSFRDYLIYRGLSLDFLNNKKR